MSHFVTYVLAPNDTTDLEAYVAEMLAPYDENMRVEPYKERCWCVGREIKAMDLAYTYWNLTAEDYRLKIYDLKDMVRDDIEIYTAGANANLIEWTAKMLKAAHPDKDKADPACEDCGGTGETECTYNPKSQWDWWTIGGRWADRGETLTISEALSSDDKAFAVVTPEGAWLEKGNMGWWGMVSDEKSDWYKTYFQTLYQYRDTHKIIVVDCHI